MSGPTSLSEDDSAAVEQYVTGVPSHLPFADELDKLGPDGTWEPPIYPRREDTHRLVAEAQVRTLVEQAREALEARRRLVGLHDLHLAWLFVEDSTTQLVIQADDRGIAVPPWVESRAEVSNRELARIEEETADAEREWERLQREHSETLERLGYWCAAVKQYWTHAKIAQLREERLRKDDSSESV